MAVERKTDRQVEWVYNGCVLGCFGTLIVLGGVGAFQSGQSKPFGVVAAVVGFAMTVVSGWNYGLARFASDAEVAAPSSSEVAEARGEVDRGTAGWWWGNAACVTALAAHRSGVRWLWAVAALFMVWACLYYTGVWRKRLPGSDAPPASGSRAVADPPISIEHPEPEPPGEPMAQPVEATLRLPATRIAEMDDGGHCEIPAGEYQVAFALGWPEDRPPLDEDMVADFPRCDLQLTTPDGRCWQVTSYLDTRVLGEPLTEEDHEDDTRGGLCFWENAPAVWREKARDAVLLGDIRTLYDTRASFNLTVDGRTFEMVVKYQCLRLAVAWWAEENKMVVQAAGAYYWSLDPETGSEDELISPVAFGWLLDPVNVLLGRGALASPADSWDLLPDDREPPLFRPVA